MSLIQNTRSIYLTCVMTLNWQPQSTLTVCLKVSKKDKIWKPKSFILHHIKKEVPSTEIIHRIIQRRFIHINCRRSAACPLLRPRPPRLPPLPSLSPPPPQQPATISSRHTRANFHQPHWKQNREMQVEIGPGSRRALEARESGPSALHRA